MSHGLSITWVAVVLLALAGCDDGSSDPADAGAAGGAGGQGGQGGQGAAGGAGGQGGVGGAGGAGGVDMSCMTDEACGPGSRCDTTDGVCQAACDSDAQCGANATCTAEGFCRPLQRCDAASPCPEGSVCSCRGVCEAAERTCNTPLQCQPDEYCDDCSGSCKRKAAACEPCADASACARQSDLCHPIGPAGVRHCLRACANNDDCAAVGPGFECRPVADGMACVPRSGDCAAPGECAADADCPPDQFCNERLACQPGCMDDVGCPMGTVCQGIRCLPPCMVDDDCGPGAVCEPDGHCEVPGGCLTSMDCEEPETYCDTDQRMCVPGCERDVDCQNANQECVGNACVERGCGGNFQCGFGQVCELESGECVEAEGRHCEPDCDPMDEMSCGSEGQRCLSLQDEEENPLGDYCFEPCMPEPNECPQGYQCVDLEDMDGNVQARLCIRRCDLQPL